MEVAEEIRRAAFKLGPMLLALLVACGEQEEIECPPGYFNAGGTCLEAYAPPERLAPTSEPADRTGYLPAAEPLPYSVVKRRDVSYATTKRMVYRVVVRTDVLPDPAHLRATGEAIWEKGNRGWDEFTVFLYLPGMNTDDIAYGVAEFDPGGLRKFRVQELALVGTRWRS
ncbi:MAG: hypothetical protein V3R89_02740 [Thermoanaerobaculia bacterium]